ncbi:MAG TPA: CDP-diacylglycerol--glycerol-3-phosphate 3-phosphatidyltransferase [Kineosporiaceae bacterium]|nr:CDP-diacylglycerol--glycerol-3-phosphate 3-phosphatidyltransferase [Kineosporiaceae bacterium]
MTVQDPASTARPVPEPDSSRLPVSAWNIANGLTALRLALVPVFGWLLLGTGERPGWRVAAAITFAVATLTDRIDGELARRWHLVTDVGKIADPIADKALMGTALVGLSVLGQLPWWVTVVVLVRELGITLMRILVIRYVVLPAGRGGKAKMAAQAVAITLYLLPLGSLGHQVAVVAMVVAVVLTVVTGLDYLWSVGAAVRNSPRAVAGRGRQAPRATPPASRPGA